MLKKVRIPLILVFFLIFLVSVSFLPHLFNFNYNVKNNEIDQPKYSASLEGAENIVVTNLFRNVTLSGYGSTSFEDSLSFTNFNNNPINSIFVGIPLSQSDELIFYKTTGEDGNTLLTERSYMIVKDYEMIAIYFDSPLLPQQTKTIKFFHQYKNLILYSQIDKQYLIYNGFVFPVLPYRAEGEIIAHYYVPEGSEDIDGGWGYEMPIPSHYVSYELAYLEIPIGDLILIPYMENLNYSKQITIQFSHQEYSNIQIKELNREIYFSPWGIMRITDDITIENFGTIAFGSVLLDIPSNAKNVIASDDLGELIFSSKNKNEMKELTIGFSATRVVLIPNSTYNFKVEYDLPFEDYYSVNWDKGSIQLDILLTKFEYLGRDQTTTIIIDGCNAINYITNPPKSIEESRGTTILTYESDYIAPFEIKLIQFTFVIDFFNLFLRPIVFMLLISFIASIYVLFVKSRKESRDKSVLKKELFPVNEIREFCSLYEEKNALFLEIRQAEENKRRKKISKNNYRKILDKNTSKIDEIQRELKPFKKSLTETNINFENIIKKLDLLEAEQTSVKDSLNLLESRYKRGRLPSRAAYLKLSDDFKKRSKKIERNIDKLIQQLRSYLL
ncbi:MAG: hypothetical protein ACFFC3_04580 [Candidatus Odinarchaeota archaeon]